MSALGDWHTRARTQYAIRESGVTKYVLIERRADDSGLDSVGYAARWRDLATFDDFHDADRVLRLIQKAEA